LNLTSSSFAVKVGSGRLAGEGHLERLRNAMFKEQASPISEGRFGILRVNGPHHIKFEIVQDDWFKSLTFEECRKYLL